MREYGRTTAIAVAIAGISLLLALMNPACVKTETAGPLCQVTLAAGKVTINRSSDGKVLQAAKGMRLWPGDTVSTGEKSMATLRFEDFAIVTLGEKTLYVVHSRGRNSDTGLIETSTELLKGIGLVKADPARKQGFIIKTPHVVAGVLGTEFGLEVAEGCKGDEGKGVTMLAVVSGKVSFKGAGGTTIVGPGCGAMCNGLMPPGLVNKFSDLDSRLPELLQRFIKAGFDEANMKTIFRYY